MAKKMLIDATHPEETRVVVADGNKVEEFDFESLNKRQLAGNIYLAKVTRVEPSLQAAFVDYGGNRHGFLAFSEIHPDYYQIPKADRDAILAEERAFAEAQAAADEAADAKSAKRLDEADENEAEDIGEEAPKKSRSRSRSRTRSRSKKATEGDAQDAGAPAAEEPAAEETDGATTAKAEIEAIEAATDAVVSGTPAEVSEAATETAGQGAVKDDETAARADGSKDQDDQDDDGPVTTIAESAGLEDETVTSGGEEADVAEAAPSDAQPEATAPAEPSGMETVDFGDKDSEGEADTDQAQAPAGEKPKRSRSRSRSRSKKAEPAEKDETVETVADDDTEEDIRPPRVQRPKARKYKIQEVVKVRQIMLVQVVKEERGNKGAALTTYLSLAGRYCVLMPNTARGGGISRKITNAVDRKKLKEIAQEIDVPQGAGLIVRTAGAKRTKTEIKRDYEYLQRMWEQVRELTLKSIAPAPIYEEGNLIHRSIRDLYNRDIDEVIVEGEAGYRDAKDYMKLIMPSHAKNVKLHAEGGQPLFAKHGVESYLAGMFNPTVQLKSGGYIVIDVTEALVAVDVNSGKSTKEGSIEDTAVKTNLEAAAEVARQAKLRDLAGLIVIDFIDMDERKNNAAVEKCLKDALKHDRARIQVGRISGFGLLEMSRQRLRPGMLEATTQACPHCQGTGLIRSDDSVALSILRALEEEGVKKRSREVKLTVPVDVCNYLMNEKREHLATIEARFDMAVRVVADPHMIAPDYSIEKFKTATRVIPKARNVVQMDTSWSPEEEDDVVESEAEEVEDAEAQQVDATPAQMARADDEGGNENGDGAPRKKRRRRSRRKKSGNGDGQNGENGQNGASDASGEGQADVSPAPKTDAADTAVADLPPQDTGAETSDVAAPDQTEDAPKPKPRSRSRSRSKKPAAEIVETPAESAAQPAEPTPEPAAEAPPPVSEQVPEAQSEEPKTATAPAKPKSRSRARAKAPAPSAAPSEPVAEVADTAEVETAPEPVQEAVTPQPAQEAPASDAPEKEAPAKPKRKGWWSFGN
ncbi:RNAse E [Jannaschia faecimaris]|uniref:Ribonuclease E n=1 Tax=Jannaschia faecimaris TaxID=1244108 RepID=A0A1H3RRQ1_9RHOB|nr:ribonuclease E/G [Jannaschia faecimaris]SDZ28035.1 RNAse E [Jannaschia faecimaris]